MLPNNLADLTALAPIPGCIFLENPPRTWQLCKQDGQSAWYSTMLRAAQAKVFHIATGDDYQHVLQYIGEGQVIHTRNGQVGIDHLQDFAPNFLKGCTILWPKLEVLVPLIKKIRSEEKNQKQEEEENEEMQKTEEVEKEEEKPSVASTRTGKEGDDKFDDDMQVWLDYWQNCILPTLREAEGCKTDVVGICITPLRRNSKPAEDASSTLWHPRNKGQSFSCTGLLARGWAHCGIDLVEGLGIGIDGVYPSDFLRSPFLQLEPIVMISLRGKEKEENEKEDRKSVV